MMRGLAFNLFFLIFCACRLFSFGYYRDIILKGNGSVQEIPLPADVYMRAEPDFRDLVLVDGKNREVPYILEPYREETRRVISGEFAGEIRQDERLPEGGREIVIRFAEEKSGLVPYGNRLQLKLRDIPRTDGPFPGEAVKILASPDGKTWRSVESPGFSLKDNTLTFLLEADTSLWYKLLIPEEAGRGPRSYLRQARLYLEEELVRDAPEDYVFLPIGDVTYGAYDADPNVTLLRIWTQRVPLDNLRLFTYTTLDSDYVLWDGSESRATPKNPLGTGRVYRSGGREETDIPLERSDPRDSLHLKLSNRNGNFGKAKIIAVRGHFYPHRLVFKKRSAETLYRLYYGNGDYLPIKTIEQLEAEEKERAALRAEKRREQAGVDPARENINLVYGERQEPASMPDRASGAERGEILDMIIVGTVILLLLGFVILLLRLLLARRPDNGAMPESAPNPAPDHVRAYDIRPSDDDMPDMQEMPE